MAARVANLENARLALVRALEVSREFPLPNNNAQYRRLLEDGLAEVNASVVAILTSEETK